MGATTEDITYLLWKYWKEMKEKGTEEKLEAKMTEIVLEFMSDTKAQIQEYYQTG